ncbi:MAG TPA: hypothetical protein VGE11_07845 [Pseudonocardia sp.]
MAEFRIRPERRDDLAADRDDAAERRDRVSDNRDAAADERDAEATRRDLDTREDFGDLDARLMVARRRLLGHIDSVTVDPVSAPNLSSPEVANLPTPAAEQRRRAGLDRAAVADLLDGIGDELRHVRSDHAAAVVERRAAASDRSHSGDDRGLSAQDRDLASRDRGQAALEREQVDPADLAQDGGSSTQHVEDPVTRAIAESRERIVSSRQRLARTEGRGDLLGSASPSHDEGRARRAHRSSKPS